jgi:hypothetical protein
MKAEKMRGMQDSRLDMDRRRRQMVEGHPLRTPSSLRMSSLAHDCTECQGRVEGRRKRRWWWWREKQKEGGGSHIIQNL